MGKCETCGKEIDDKYKFCLTCVQKMKEDNKATGANASNNDDIIKALGAINNNLYALRTMQEAILEKEHKLKLVWSSQDKKFIIKKKAKK